jgi:hypothetical protein
VPVVSAAAFQTRRRALIRLLAAAVAALVVMVGFPARAGAAIVADCGSPTSDAACAPDDAAAQIADDGSDGGADSLAGAGLACAIITLAALASDRGGKDRDKDHDKDGDGGGRA